MRNWSFIWSGFFHAQFEYEKYEPEKDPNMETFYTV